jgi:A/G-specific adenine glycosylase
MPVRGLLKWYAENGRDLPWRHTADPYRILISEVMLQQTQVDRVVPKYEVWLEAYPNWRKLAHASRADVLRLWSGLGYNSRAVRLHALAKLLVEEHNGKLPANEEELRKLPGIGPYTAGAIMVFAHNEPGSCIDVNVRRIVNRIYFSKKTGLSKRKPEKMSAGSTGISRGISIRESEAVFLKSFPAKRATDYGNALMDFGSAVCTATRPKCDECPVFKLCKSKGPRPEENQERARKKQQPFLHSNRWYRGQILKTLTTAQLSESELWKQIGGDSKKDFEKALEQLRQERLVRGSRRLRL